MILFIASHLDAVHASILDTDSRNEFQAVQTLELPLVKMLNRPSPVPFEFLSPRWLHQRRHLVLLLARWPVAVMITSVKNYRLQIGDEGMVDGISKMITRYDRTASAMAMFRQS